MRRILAFAFRIFRRPDLVPAIRGRHLGSAIGWAVASWALFGLHLCSLFFALGHLNASIVIPAISGYALSWAVGFLAVFAPAGAGVREAILVLLFAGSIGGADVLGVAVVSRMIFILVDVTLFGSSALSWRFSNRNRSAEPRQSETS
ncbi:hypothetical protein [Humibacter ginsenosidimutans]|uniref:hypothetical protein n=1 Tax=Humibacter ginsenosidimutans TaxID=2599293 RepID=UPI001FEDD2AD|nr:hypothetical protein [Humibacter ginsenosidimutans]